MPCSRRCKQIEYNDDKEKVIESDDADGGWVDTHHYDPTNLDEKVSEMTIEESQYDEDPVNDKNAAGENKDDDDDEDDDEVCDMDEFEKEGFPVEDEDEVSNHLIKG